VAYRASVQPRGGATSTHWLGEQVEARARQGLPGGGRGSSNSDELAARPEQHAQGRATGTLVELGATRVCEERQPEVEFIVSTTGGGNGGSVCGRARGGEVSSFIGARALWRGSRESSDSGLRHGQGGGAAANSCPGAVRHAYGDVAVGWPSRTVSRGP
jgi:hypothetical protein